MTQWVCDLTHALLWKPQHFGWEARTVQEWSPVQSRSPSFNWSLAEVSAVVHWSVGNLEPSRN